MNIDSKDLVSLRELQLLAMEKGLLVAVGIKDSLWQFDAADDGEIGYAVVKQIAGIKYAVDKSGRIVYETYCDGPFCNWTIWFRHSLAEAWEIVKNFKMEEKSPDSPKFYGFIRIYEGENKHLYYAIQRMLLEHWAEKNNIQFEEIFGCIGGFAEFQGEPTNVYEIDNYDGVCNAMYSCKKFFDKMEANDVLCVTDWGRLDGHMMYWNEIYHILDISMSADGNLLPYIPVPNELNNTQDDYPF